jgi:flagellar basal-body rod modification protein FlgD
MDGTSAISGGTSTKTVAADQVGFAGLTADDFMKLLIAQLQNQDPTNPMDNDQLLSQISTMRNLQSNIELSKTLKSMTGNQQLSTASNFIGKFVVGRSTTQQDIGGVANRAFVRDGLTYLGVGDQEILLTDVSDVLAY